MKKEHATVCGLVDCVGVHHASHAIALHAASLVTDAAFAQPSIAH